MQRRIVIATGAAAALALALAAPAGAATVKGTVVHKDKRHHRFVVAQRGGKLAVVSARRTPRVGRAVAVSGHSASGVLAARRLRAAGLRRHARLRGTVTWRSRNRRRFTVSAAGASIPVRDDRRGSGSDAVPPVGEDVTVDVGIDEGGNLESGNVDDHGEDTNGMEVEGRVLAIDTTARTLTLSADDCHQTNASITVNVPASFDLGGFSVGQEVELRVVKADDGSLVLAKVLGSGEGLETGDRGDHGEHGDRGDDQGGDGQGDGAPGGGDHGGQGGEGDHPPEHGGAGGEHGGVAGEDPGDSGSDAPTRA